MCGITGIIGSKQRQYIQAMTDAIRHRGPDDEGFFSDECLSLGMRRLSIIDLTRGRQPIESSDGRYLIFFNGEIYNYKEIKTQFGDYKFKTDSDTEVALVGFIKWGEKVLERLRGMFALAIYDRKKKELLLARDFFGIKPLYYLSDQGDSSAILAFSSEMKSFLALPSFQPEVNDEAVFNYLSFQYNPLAETFLKNVYKVPPGHFLKIDAKTGISKINKYWQFKFEADDALDEEKSADKILETMEDSVAHHMIADVPVGSFLSGGIDSSIIATLMQKIRGDGKVKTFTVDFGSLSESREALETAKPLATDHHQITVDPDEYFRNLSEVAWHFDEPVADPSAVGLYFLAREASKHVKVVLSGEGSDELFGGYNIYLEPFARRRITWIPRFILRSIVYLPLNFRGKNYLNRALQRLEDWYIGNALIFKKSEIEKLLASPVMSKTVFDITHLYEEAEGLSDSTKMQYIDIHTWLVGDILAKADKMTMAHSLELRVPFLDIEVSTLASSLPDRFKWKNGATKYLLRKAFKGVLPESTRLRKKLGFPIPIRDWLIEGRGDVRDTILNNSYIKSHFDVQYIEKLINDHRAKRVDNSRKIYLLLMLAIWYNVFVK